MRPTASRPNSRLRRRPFRDEQPPLVVAGRAPFDEILAPRGGE
ncbi:MAG: hypothetical protein WKF58_01935 [Ilumatobacteraceae bacterium]